MQKLKGILREPLIHFLAAGGVLFGAYAWLNGGSSGKEESDARRVQITTNKVAWLKEMWARQWQREPTREELRGLVTDFLKEELLAREARAMGLDEDDIIVRRRLAQKLEFLVQDTSRLAEPTENDLRRFHAAHAERFHAEARISFTHVYFSRERRKDADADAKAALTELSQAAAAAGEAPATTSIGDRLLLDSEIVEADEQTVASQFGPGFAQAVFVLKPGAWHGPIASGYGLHLVWVSELKPGRQPKLEEVKGQVLAGWREARQREDYEKYFAGLLKKYELVVGDESLKPLVSPLDTRMAAPGNGSTEGGVR